MFKPLSLIILSGLLTLGACSKKSTETKTEKTKSDLITTSTWKYSNAGYDLDNNGTIDGSLPASVVLSCDTDNRVTFKSDKTGTVDEGATKCDASAPQTTSFTWSLANNDTEMTFSGAIFAGVGGNVKIVELTDSKLVLSKQVTVPGFPLPIPVVIVLVH